MPPEIINFSWRSGNTTGSIDIDNTSDHYADSAQYSVRYFANWFDEKPLLPKDLKEALGEPDWEI